MKIRFRKANDTPHRRIGDTYEWRPEGSKNDKWYSVKRKDILVLETSETIRKIFNSVLAGQEILLDGIYFNHSYGKTLYIKREVIKECSNG